MIKVLQLSGRRKANSLQFIYPKVSFNTCTNYFINKLSNNIVIYLSF